MDDIERLKQEAAEQSKAGREVSGMATAFPKNPPPPGMSYSRNLARFLQQGAFAVQTKG